MTLADDLAAAKLQLTKDQAALDQADARANAAEFELTAANAAAEQLRQAVASDLAEVARIQKEIDAQVPPSTGTLGGMWCQSGGAWQEFQRLQGLLGVKVLGFRSTGGEGQLDNPFMLPDSHAALAAGHVVSLQLQPKTGSGSNRTGVPYRDITAGKHDATLLAGFAEYKALPPNAKVPLEVHSEFTVQSSGAQPPVGPAGDYAPFVMHVDKLLRQAGVRDRVTTICGAVGKVWDGNSWKAWITPELMASGACDVLGTDFYAKVSNKLAQPDAMTKGVRTVARSFGVRWAVMETGCVELPGNPGAKAAWYGAWEPLLKAEGKDCYAVFFNASLFPYRIDSTPASFAAFKHLMSAPLWRKS